MHMKEILERHTDIDHGIAREDFESYLSHLGIATSFANLKYRRNIEGDEICGL